MNGPFTCACAITNLHKARPHPTPNLPEKNCMHLCILHVLADIPSQLYPLLEPYLIWALEKLGLQSNKGFIFPFAIQWVIQGWKSLWKVMWQIKKKRKYLSPPKNSSITLFHPLTTRTRVMFSWTFALTPLKIPLYRKVFIIRHSNSLFHSRIAQKSLNEA